MKHCDMVTRSCSACQQPHDRPGRYCRPCHAAYMRTWRQTHPLTAEQRRKDICRSYTSVLVRRGQLTRQPCIFCSSAAEAHHPDYDQPRLVIWLCRPHHLWVHALHDPAPATAGT